MGPQPVGKRNIGSRTVVITGGNAGLGLACANAILKSPNGAPWHIILACRDEVRAQAAVDQLRSDAEGAGQVEAMSLDLASLASVRSFAAELTKRLSTGSIPPLHAVVCNAGVNPLNTKTVTVDGFESTFGINHLGHFLLVNELLPALQAPARVVVVASGVHDPAQKAGVPAPAWNNPVALAHGELGPAAASDKALASGQRRYSTSKLANVYFTYALARRLPSGITANAFDPGLMPGTGLMREAPAALRFILRHIPIALLRRLFSPNVHTAEESGDALARLVTDPELNTTTGRYFEGRRQIRSSDESYDDERAVELWNASVILTAANQPAKQRVASGQM
jgi:NAD(P)-dependent dehydrogenase (short-subunit alcohol dehydrogenase family)